MASLRNEQGVMLVAAILLLFFVSLFLFTIVSWHDKIYKTYDAIELYYMNEAIQNMKRGGT
ncbi:hypothetical protein AU377_02445 [Sporosarcina sp. HYO08]|nr:hypothetical protein AU377_02445 [Sporosarcina sp. HYO08]